MQRDAFSIGRGLELRHLRAFVAVAEELHFGRAARRLHLAQPPLSQQIRQLEAVIGTPLFVRTSRSVQLTPAGVALLARARRTLSNVQDDVLEARRIGQGAVGVLRVGFAGSVILSVLPALLSRYRANIPGVDLKLRESFTAQVVAGLLNGDLDAGIVRDGDPTPGITLQRLYEEPYVAVLPAGHSAAAQASVPVTVLRDEPWVYYPGRRASGRSKGH
ncbi:LysR family transcriptional regulator [Deinococcus sp. KNUC1210]|uniref:LysR family transcriptional regulator n=1 Tax=Deinococcus sp. KNUC1210 TaxID=2917691 RepID=UPI002105B740|nr:LysR substrate-binding domain-containing protein [Deinococcus sp. KNUC1210]